MLKRIFKILFLPAVISIPIAVALIVFLPLRFNYYNIKLENKLKVGNRSCIQFRDLNNDAWSEEIRLYNDYPLNSSLYVLSDGASIGQWSFDKENFKIAFGDYDHNDLTEVYVFTFDEDSIYINYIEPYSENNITPNIPICRSSFINGKIDTQIQSVIFTDLNSDGTDEFVFSVITAFSGGARGIFAYDLVNKKLISSQLIGIGLYNIFTCDLNHDGKKEILGNTFAHSNCKGLPYSDTLSWLLIFNNELEFYHTPIQIGHYPGSATVVPLKKDSSCYLLVYNRQTAVGKSSSLILFDSAGRKVKEKTINKGAFLADKSYLISNPTDPLHTAFLFYGNGDVFIIDTCINIKNYTKLNFNFIHNPEYLDIDNDGYQEILLKSSTDNEVLIARHDFSNPATFEFDYFADTRSAYSTFVRKKLLPLLCIHLDEDLYYYRYEKNRFYFFKYAYYCGLYLLSFLFIWLVNKSQEYSLVQKFKNRQLISELRLKSIQNQINPHFTLNILNSIGTLFMKKDHEKAEFVFDKYSKLLKSTVLGSGDFTTTLNSEVKYIDNYLKLEQFRSDNKFDYNIDTSKDVDMDTIIPKMLIHTFVENSIKHGIRHLEHKGHLSISITNSETDIKVEIHDNGIGRKKAAEYSKYSTGRGLKILDQMIAFYKDEKKVKIKYEITDLYNSKQEAAGTKVKIMIPLHKNKSIRLFTKTR